MGTTTAAHAARLLAYEVMAARVLRTLTDAGVEALLLKGASIERWLYDGEDERHSGDVDVIVAPWQVGEAESCLTSLGFVNRYDGLSPRWSPLHADRWAASDWPLPIDLHRRLWSVGASPAATWRVLRAHRTTLMLAAGPVPVLDEPGRALLIALHAAHHGAGEPKPMGDLRRALERLAPEDWAAVHALANELRAEAVLAAGLGLLEEGRAVRDELGLPEADPSAFVQDERMLDAPQTTEFFLRLRRASGTRERVRLAAREAVPSRNFMQQQSPYAPMARRGSRGLAMAYVMRLAALARALPSGVRTAWRLEHEPEPYALERGQDDRETARPTA